MNRLRANPVLHRQSAAPRSRLQSGIANHRHREREGAGSIAVFERLAPHSQSPHPLTAPKSPSTPSLPAAECLDDLDRPGPRSATTSPGSAPGWLKTKPRAPHNKGTRGFFISLAIAEASWGSLGGRSDRSGTAAGGAGVVNSSYCAGHGLEHAAVQACREGRPWLECPIGSSFDHLSRDDPPRTNLEPAVLCKAIPHGIRTPACWWSG
jgi:hypothetical protein